MQQSTFCFPTFSRLEEGFDKVFFWVKMMLESDIKLNSHEITIIVQSCFKDHLACINWHLARRQLVFFSFTGNIQTWECQS